MQSLLKHVSLLLVVLLVVIKLSSANNYQEYINEIERRNKLMHDAYVEMPGVREEIDNNLGDIYDSEGNPLTSSADEDDEETWKRLVESIKKVRQNTKQQLAEHKRQMQADERLKVARFPEIYAQLDGDNNEGDDEVSDNEDNVISTRTGAAAGRPDKQQLEKEFENFLEGVHRISSQGGNSQPRLLNSNKLPAYCDPPNPCPLGVDPDKVSSPCQTNIPDTREFNRAWILRKMEQGECSCDTEHMKHCPPGTIHNEKRSAGLEKQSINDQKRNKGVVDDFHMNIAKKTGPYKPL